MRVISGEFKGRQLKAAPGTRPTSDFVRQALFSILGGSVSGTFVDLYAGSGGVGIEARSRGAEVVLVERDPQALEVLRGNLKRIDLRGGVSVVAVDVLRFLKHPEASDPPIEPAPVDVVFADPPYDYPVLEKLLRYLEATSLVGPKTLVVVEHGIRTHLSPPDGLELTRETSHGETRLSFLRRDAVRHA